MCIGAGRWIDDAFVVAQAVATSADDEPELIDWLADFAKGAAYWVTYNGATFDVPFLRDIKSHHDAIWRRPHVDLLPVSRATWPSLSSHTLAAVERHTLELQRVDDLPGSAVPRRYRKYLKSGDRRHLDGVLLHNQLDVLAMAGIAAATAAAKPAMSVVTEAPARSQPKAVLTPVAKKTRKKKREKPSQAPRARGRVTSDVTIAPPPGTHYNPPTALPTRASQAHAEPPPKRRAAARRADPEQTSQRHRQRGTEDATIRSEADTVRYYRDALQTASTHARRWLCMREIAKAERRRGDTAEALRVLLEMATLPSTDPFAFVQLAQIYEHERDDPDAALTYAPPCAKDAALERAVTPPSRAAQIRRNRSRLVAASSESGLLSAPTHDDASILFACGSRGAIGSGLTPLWIWA